MFYNTANKPTGDEQKYLAHGYSNVWLSYSFRGFPLHFIK